MSENYSPKPYPKNFRPRRGLNWFSLGLMYATYYMCRYNFRFATPGLREEFGFNFNDITDLFSIWALAYGTGQLINGLLADRIGGKKCMLFGAVATICINFTLGFSPLVSTFTSFALLSLLNGYFQSFGAPGMIKINAAWFRRTERGIFAGIFGGMIQLGQMAISKLGPFILNSGVIIGGVVMAQKGDWRYLFIIPPIFTSVAAVIMFFCVKDEPEQAGFANDVIMDELDDSEGVQVSIKESLVTIFSHPVVWFYACAYACTGAVRHSLDQLAILYFEDQLGFNMQSEIPAIASNTLLLMPLVAFLGSLCSGFVSDKLFKGHRSPVAAFLYFFEAFVISLSAVILTRGLVGPTTSGIWIGCIILICIAATVNSTHSLVGAAAPMDIGGKKMAGTAAGVIDSFQYFGAAIAFQIVGPTLEATKDDYGYLFWYVIMAAFGVLGGIAMLMLIFKMRKPAAMKITPYTESYANSFIRKLAFAGVAVSLLAIISCSFSYRYQGSTTIRTLVDGEKTKIEIPSRGFPIAWYYQSETDPDLQGVRAFLFAKNLFIYTFLIGVFVSIGDNVRRKLAKP